MNYQEIAAKYDGKVKERVSHLAFLKARIDVLKLSRQQAIAAREEYRMNGTPSAERSAMWNHFSYRIKSLDKRLSDAELDYAKASIGANIDELDKKLMI